MCGIVGCWSRTQLRPDETRAQVEAMRDAISHRGPDDVGVWMSGAIAFGHRRLAIVDLSPFGHQPMTSRDGRYTICFNGEVFNFQDLRDELSRRGHEFSGGSDTEVMLTAICEWGLIGAVQRFVGMFAFALWDSREAKLHLVRDRIGIKPIFVGRTNAGDLLFGSELKALMAHPAFERKVDPAAVVAYLRFSYVPSPLSVFANAVKVAPGHVMSFDGPSDPGKSFAYWSVEELAGQPRETSFNHDIDEAVDALDALLRNAVALRMIADVPLGAFLSGGIDSSLVVSLMQAQSGRPVKTFTIGFEETGFDESVHARSIAEYLGTEHTEDRVTAVDALRVIPSLASMYDEPLADSSQVPTYLVSALARRHVTVALSGDGGDELFGGYARYQFAPRAWRTVRHIPPYLRHGGARILRATANNSLVPLNRIGPGVAKVADLLDAPHLEALYCRLVSTTMDPLSLTTFTSEPSSQFERLLASETRMTPLERMMLADVMVYLPDDLLTKFDRASMAVGLEGRVPILDHRVVEFAWRLPPRLRQRKLLLHRVLGRYIPPALFERPKMGFEVPIGLWLRTQLRPWADEMLGRDSLQHSGIFNAAAVRREFEAHLAGRTNNAHLVWTILMFEAWRREWRASI